MAHAGAPATAAACQSGWGPVLVVALLIEMLSSIWTKPAWCSAGTGAR